MTYLHCDRCGAVIGEEASTTPVYGVLLKRKESSFDSDRKAQVSDFDLCDQCYKEICSFMGISAGNDNESDDKTDDSREFVNRDL